MISPKPKKQQETFSKWIYSGLSSEVFLARFTGWEASRWGMGWSPGVPGRTAGEGWDGLQVCPHFWVHRTEAGMSRYQDTPRLFTSPSPNHLEPSQEPGLTSGTWLLNNCSQKIKNVLKWKCSSENSCTNCDSTAWGVKSAVFKEQPLLGSSLQVTKTKKAKN